MKRMILLAGLLAVVASAIVGCDKRITVPMSTRDENKQYESELKGIPSDGK
jgi:hypothetical protein